MEGIEPSPTAPKAVMIPFHHISKSIVYFKSRPFEGVLSHESTFNILIHSKRKIKSQAWVRVPHTSMESERIELPTLAL
jgi:hypothetical protein